MIITAKDIVAKLAPSAKSEYIAAFKDKTGLIATAGITTPLRLAHFMAQVLHETGGLTTKIESGNYSAKNLGQMWDSGNWHRYFKDRAACVAMAEQCKKDGGVALFSLVYGNRMGNGAPDTKDGWTYRGRGIIQTTGRESYRKFGKRCGVAFEQDPDLIISGDHALKPALAEWTDRDCNAGADHNDIELITRRINGGTVGLEARKAWFAKVWPFVIGAPPVKNAATWKVQAALARLGDDCGDPDGFLGARTKAAILDYRAKKKLPLRPTIDAALLSALGIG